MLTTTQRPKACASCGSSFLPFLPMARACSAPCALKMARAERLAREEAKKLERKQDKAKKDAMKRLPDLAKEAEEVFNRWVRARDVNQPCISCGKPAQTDYGYQGGRDAGHYRSVGAAAHLRFHEDNVHAQCVKCNQHKAGNAVDYRLGLIARIGIARVEALESLNAVHKWTREELIAIKATYRAKLKALKDSTH